MKRKQTTILKKPTIQIIHRNNVARGDENMRTISTDEIIKNIKEMCIEVNHVLSADMKEALDTSVQTEKSPMGRQILCQLQENLEIGAYAISDKAKCDRTMEKIYGHFPRLKERRKQLAGTLSGGEQQMLAMGRALMSDPTLLMLDEPSMGLSPIMVSEIFNIIKEVNREGITIFLVEQNAKMALSIANRAYVLETGKVLMEGNAHELMDNDEVRKAYLGA